MKTKLILTVLTVALCIGAFVAFSLSQPRAVPPPAVAAERFDQNNYNLMPVDTFQAQLQLSYGDAVQVTRTEQELNVRYQPADGNTSGFYNHNEALKESGGKGFSMKQEDKALMGSFRIDKSLVTVPNDVLLGMLKKSGGKPVKNEL